jgi:biotin synthase
MPILKELVLEKDVKIFEKANKITREKNIIFSSSIPISTFCRIQPPCRHCEWQSNLFFHTNRKKEIPEKLFIKKALKKDGMGIKRLVLSSGWQGEDLPPFFYKYIHNLALKASSEIWCAFGTINKNSLQNLKKLGVTGYSCGIETTNQDIFQKVRPGDHYKKRINTIEIAKELGMKVETAIVVGIGEEIQDIVDSIALMKKLDVDYAAIWPFCPCPFTQMERENIPNSFFVAKILSIMVIYLKDKNIVGDTRPKNFKWSIRAGANVFGVSKKEDCKKIAEMRENYLNRDFLKDKG